MVLSKKAIDLCEAQHGWCALWGLVLREESVDSVWLRCWWDVCVCQCQFSEEYHNGIVELCIHDMLWITGHYTVPINMAKKGFPNHLQHHKWCKTAHLSIHYTTPTSLLQWYGNHQLYWSQWCSREKMKMLSQMGIYCTFGALIHTFSKRSGRWPSVAYNLQAIPIHSLSDWLTVLVETCLQNSHSICLVTAQKITIHTLNIMQRTSCSTCSLFSAMSFLLDCSCFSV